MLTWFGNGSRDQLIANLNQPQKFAAAHVALTELTEFTRTSIPIEDTKSFQFVEMRYDLAPGNRPLFEFDSQLPLQKWWLEFLDSYDIRRNQTLRSGVLIFGDLRQCEVVWPSTNRSARCGN